MPEEPDEVFYDLGNIVSESSKPKKLIRADNCYHQANLYGNQLVDNENRFRKYLWLAILSVFVTAILIFIWSCLQNNGQQVDLSVLTLPQVNHVPEQVSVQSNTEALQSSANEFAEVFLHFGKVLQAVVVLLGVSLLIAGVFDLYKHAQQGRHHQVSLFSIMSKLISGVMMFFMVQISGIFAGSELENSATNIQAKPSYTEQIEAFKDNQTLETWNGIKPLFDIPANKPYLNYIKSATGDAQSVKAVVAEARSGKLKLQDNDHYICQLEEQYDRQVEISACKTYQDFTNWINCLFLVMSSLSGMAVILSFTQWQGIRRRAINYQNLDKQVNKVIS